jgi:FkbM family methyltransferase
MTFISKLSPGSIPVYTFWRLLGRAVPVNLKLAAGPRLQFRPKTRTDNDYGTAYEIFVHGYYDIPDNCLEKSKVALVVDLGSNVGFTCLHWLALCPNARVIAFEPHPAHVNQLRKNLALNKWEAKVEIHSAAAGTRTENVWLSDAGTSSAVQSNQNGGLEIAMEDFFVQCGSKRIDILKMDIEGGEYALLEDKRFEGLSVRLLVMEWHTSDQQGRNGEWCYARLGEMGYRTSTIFDAGSHGMLSAFRGQ